MLPSECFPTMLAMQFSYIPVMSILVIWALIQLVLPPYHSDGRLKEPISPYALLRSGILRDDQIVDCSYLTFGTFCGCFCNISIPFFLSFFLSSLFSFFISFPFGCKFVRPQSSKRDVCPGKLFPHLIAYTFPLCLKLCSLNLLGGFSPFILNTYGYSDKAFDLSENAAYWEGFWHRILRTWVSVWSSEFPTANAFGFSFLLSSFL